MFKLPLIRFDQIRRLRNNYILWFFCLTIVIEPSCVGFIVKPELAVAGAGDRIPGCVAERWKWSSHPFDVYEIRNTIFLDIHPFVTTALHFLSSLKLTKSHDWVTRAAHWLRGTYNYYNTWLSCYSTFNLFQKKEEFLSRLYFFYYLRQLLTNFNDYYQSI